MYQKIFKKYLDDLSAKKPSPGGGSAAALALCTGISLIQKAINYSTGKNLKQTAGKKSLARIKNKVLKYVDKDGEIFEKFITSSGKKKIAYLKKSNELVVDLGKSAISAIDISKGVESGIKKSIISDFYTGLNFVRLSLSACCYNLEDNSRVLGKTDKNIGVFKKYAGR
ncbi:MAG: cyclodeaminase/cyclohydrolase family protein [Candidatus Omnitrophica bacterium]|nr:cyclodeaminase/cyclohydrolase family protein [Candidatus Omnitrophota bacterium]